MEVFSFLQKRARSPEPSTSHELKKRNAEVSQSPGVATKTPVSKIHKDSGKILLTYGQKLQNWKNINKLKAIIRKGEQNHISSDATYGFELLSDKVRVLQSTNKTVGQELCVAWVKSDPVEIMYTSHANIKSQKQIRTWGRIRCDKSQNGKTSVFLEGCVRFTDLRDVPIERIENYVEIDLSNIPNYSFYPGQIVALQATNPTGMALVASKIFEGHLLKPIAGNQLTDNLRLMVASGPLSTLDSLNCDPLWDFVDRVVEEEPHVLILAGPFVEYTHPELKEHKACTFQEIFENTVAKLMSKLEGKCTQVVIVSSHRDAHHDSVYPTREYSTKQNHKNLHFMPDPCTLSINDINISMTTVDSIMHLGRKEITFKPKNTDKLSRLANYILSEGFFYPLYPPAKEITLDTTLWQRHTYMEVSPHLLILPSDMRHFCKPINGTVVVNPERLNKRIYARIEVRPSRNKAWSHEQVSCEIVKV